MVSRMTSRTTPQSKIARATILIRDLVQTMRQHIHLACQRPSHHQFLAVVNDSLGASRTSDNTLVKPGKCPLIAAIDEEVVDVIAKVITYGTIDWPDIRQVLARL